MDRVSGLVVFFVGAFILWQGRHLPVGSLRRPGAGFFPTLMALALMLLSLLLVIPRSKKEKEKQPIAGKSIIRLLTVLAGLLTYFLFLEYLGFIVMSFLLMAFLFMAFGSQRWQRWHIAAFRAFIAVGLAYLLFDILLEGNLPKGVFGF